MEAPLTAHDRCDRCGAQARARTVHENGPLLWCGHHFQQHEEPLTPMLVTYVSLTDETPVEAGV